MVFEVIRWRWLLLLILVDAILSLVAIWFRAGESVVAVPQIVGWTVVCLFFNVFEAAILALFRIRIWPYFVVNCFCSALVLWGCYFIVSYCAA